MYVDTVASLLSVVEAHSNSMRWLLLSFFFRSSVSLQLSALLELHPMVNYQREAYGLFVYRYPVSVTVETVTDSERVIYNDSTDFSSNGGIANSYITSVKQ